MNKNWLIYTKTILFSKIFNTKYAKITTDLKVHKGLDKSTNSLWSFLKNLGDLCVLKIKFFSVIRIRITLIFLLFNLSFYSQDKEYVQKICNQLSSKNFAGRGYTIFPKDRKSGVEKSREFILKEIKNIGGYDLEKYVLNSKDFSNKENNFSKYSISNKVSKPKITFTANNIYFTKLVLDDKELILGKDYIPDASCPNVDFSGELVKYDSVYFINKEKGIIFKIENKLMFSTSQKQEDVGMIFLNQEVIEKNKNSFKCSLNVKSKIEEVKTDNIFAFIPGKEIPDSFIVFTAHYDHLGNIDTTYFPGANDNASGVATLLDLMRYYKNNPTKHSVAFFFFTGEEIGLLGSKYYVEHPLFDLNRIKVLINLDLMGGGSEGIMVVNGKIFQDDFNTLKKINEEKGYNISIHSRGKAQNSDHYWFTEKGVKSFFIYTMGDINAYHDIYDKANKLTFTNYETIFKLLIEWVKK